MARSSLSSLFYPLASLSSSSSRNEKKSQTESGRWRVKERGANSLLLCACIFFSLSLCALLEARDARDRLEYRWNDF